MITAVKNQNRHLRESCFPNRKSCAYDTERATLKANIAEMEKALEKVRDTKADIDRFAALIRKYTSFEKLDRFMLHELIDRITIYETPGMGRCRKGKEKRITIYYKFVGAIQ